MEFFSEAVKADGSVVQVAGGFDQSLTDVFRVQTFLCGLHRRGYGLGLLDLRVGSLLAQ
jgi:hypothetical protein